MRPLSFYYILAGLFLSTMLLGACGIKPNSLDAPPGVENDTYPRTYPDVSTDPSPEPY
ncbi:MAG: hypothetical protein H6868_06370 [Rhodospirillales bacterium]|nr:hypothetical protein [Rhodospirillales bacterium]